MGKFNSSYSGADIDSAVKAVLDGTFQNKLIAGDGIKIEGPVISNDIDHTIYATKEELGNSLIPYAKKEDVEKTLNDYEKTSSLDVKLSEYEKTTDVDAKLAEYEKTSDVNSKLSSYAEKVYVDNADEQINILLNRIYQTIGVYTDRPSVILTPIEDNKAINKDGVKITKNGWAIAEFSAVKGNEYLFKPGTMDSNVCIFAEKITKEETRAIDYSYTYDENGRIATAKATYGGVSYSYTYTYVLNEEGNVVSETITNDATGQVVSNLPYDYKTSVGTYQPMTILNAAAELPKDGYCRLVSHFQNDTSITIVVSYNKSDADLTMLALRDGFTASICTQLGNLSKRIGNALDFSNALSREIEKAKNDLIRSISALNSVYSLTELPKLNGQPIKLFGNGAPIESNVPSNWIQFKDGGYNWNGIPSAIGQEYIDVSVSVGGHYIAVRDGNFGLKWQNL